MGGGLLVKDILEIWVRSNAFGDEYYVGDVVGEEEECGNDGIESRKENDEERLKGSADKKARG